MLVLQRKVDQSIMIGDDIQIKVVECHNGHVRLGIIAPRDIRVHRLEVYQEIHGLPDDPHEVLASKFRRPVAAVAAPATKPQTETETEPTTRDRAETVSDRPGDGGKVS